MRGEKDKLMRAELTKSIESLPASVEYALIMFSGPPWYAGQTHQRGGDKKDKFYNDYVVDGSKKWKWYGGWDESKRVGQQGRALVFLYEEEGDENLPEGKYVKASRSNVRKTIKQIEETPLSAGTDWRAPLKMAMNMKPDTIYFMTDGAIPDSNPTQNRKMIDDLVDYNRSQSRAKINTICMMVLNAQKELEDLADKTRGEFSLVKADGTVVRGRDIKK